jgi:hypothetical protein
MRCHRIIPIILMSFSAPVVSAAAADDAVHIYVASDGDDASPGTKEKPVRTPGRARDLIRQTKRDRGGKSGAPVTVHLRGGIYFLSEPIVLTPEDGGTAMAPVVYAAHEGEKPVLSAGRAVTGWAKKQLNGREVWAATLKPAEKSGALRSLWVGGRRAVRARHPNTGYLSVDAVPEATGEWNKGVGSFKFAGDDLKASHGLDESCELVVMSRWVESRLPVKSADDAAKTVSFSKKSVFVVEKGDRYWAEGAAAFLDAPGEWNFDRESSTLYYLPRPGEDMASAQAVVPAMSHVLRLEGKPDAGRSVEYVTFRGIQFSHADWSHDWPGGDNTRSGFSQAAIGVPAALYAEGARHCVFDHCIVAHVGTYGIELGRGCRDNRILACTLTDLGAGGVKIGETAIRDAEYDQALANEVSDCRITDGGNLFPSAIGVWIGQSYDNRILHNEIADFYYTGISVGWTWGYGKALARGNRIEHNHVHHIGKPADDANAAILSDMAGIYTLGIQPGTVIRNNRFHDIAGIKYGGWGIYFDEGSSQIVAENNLVYRTTHGGFHQHYGKDNVFRNNVIAFGRDAQVQRTRSESHRSFTFERNIVYWAVGDPLTGNWDNRNVAFDRNVYWRTDGKTDFRLANMTPAEWKKQGMDVQSVIADPGFVKPDADDFTLRPGGPAQALGFQPIDYADVGPRAAR